MKEAEKKGAIVIVPAWNTSIDMDKVEFFPNRKMSKDKELTNLMIVASSDKKGNPVMDTNYGANTLDIYAPGTDIYSAYMGDTYRTGTGEGLAAATVAGVATLIKSYFPKLTGSQIRDILLKSVTSRKGVEVEKGIRVDDRPSQDLFLFDDLCISGGIVNAYQAILEAEKMNSKRNDMKRAEILTGLWLLMFLIYGKECMSQIQIRFATLFPMNWYTTKSLFLSQSTALKRNISSTPVAKPERCTI